MFLDPLCMLTTLFTLASQTHQKSLAKNRDRVIIDLARMGDSNCKIIKIH